MIESFGIAAVCVMVVSYGCEKLHPFFIASFSLGCLMAAVYAYLIQSYPFLVAETLWAFIAFKRWYDAVGKEPVRESCARH